MRTSAQLIIIRPYVLWNKKPPHRDEAADLEAVACSIMTPPTWAAHLATFPARSSSWQRLVLRCCFYSGAATGVRLQRLLWVGFLLVSVFSNLSKSLWEGCRITAEVMLEWHRSKSHPQPLTPDSLRCARQPSGRIFLYRDLIHEFELHVDFFDVTCSQKLIYPSDFFLQ